MVEVVINRCFGGFGLSHEGTLAYAKRKGIELTFQVSDICKKVYGDDAVVENPDVMVEYYTSPDKDSDSYFYPSGYEIRSDPDLVATVREMGVAANSRFAKLEIVEIPDDVEWEIEEYDGSEHVAEKHRTW